MVLLDVDGNQNAMKQLLKEINEYDPQKPSKKIKKELKELAAFLKDPTKNTNGISIVEYKEEEKEMLSSNIYVVYIKPDDSLISELLDNKNN